MLSKDAFTAQIIIHKNGGGGGGGVLHMSAGSIVVI